MDKNLAAAVGEHSSVLLFRAAGIETIGADTAQQAQAAVDTLAQKGYKVIFLTEALAAQIPDTLRRYAEVPYPAILPIPDSSGSTGFGMKKITENMEKAIGTNIFDK